MPWTTPITKSSGQVMQASDWNTNTSTNMLFVAQPPRAYASMSSSQSIPDGVGAYTAVTINNLQVGGSGDNPTLVSNTLRPQVAGLYRCIATVTFPNNGTGQRLARITLNGTTAMFATNVAVAPGQPTTLWVEAWITCAVGDQIGVGCAQNSNAALSIQTNCFLAMELISV